MKSTDDKLPEEGDKEITKDIFDNRWVTGVVGHSHAALRVARRAKLKGNTGWVCGCVKGTLDMRPSSEARRKGAWDYLRDALNRLKGDEK